MNKEELLKKYLSENKENEDMFKKFYFTFSELKDTIDILEELKIFKKLEMKNIYEKIESDLGRDRKRNSEILIKKIRLIRNPIMTESFEKLDKILNKIKRKGIKIEIPQNFEGNGIKIELNLESESKGEKILEHINSNSKNILELLKIVKRGG